MTRWVLLPTFKAGAATDDVDRWVRAVRALEQEHPEIRRSDVDLDLPPGFGGGDATWDLETPGSLGLPDAVDLLVGPESAVVERCARVALDPVAGEVDTFDGPRVKRTLLLTVRAGTTPEVVERFEASMAEMGSRVPEIRSWALSRVDPARSDGSWTHAWEQEFGKMDDLLRGYMRADYHLTAVDRWFDPEIPGSIVEPSVANLVRPANAPVLLFDHPVG